MKPDEIIQKLQDMYPGKETYDLDGRGQHFVCEIEPVSEHSEYDTAAEVIIQSKPHKHLKMTQTYTIVEGELELYCDDEMYLLKKGDVHTILPGIVHWAKGSADTLSILHSRPGWTKEDHIVVEV